MILNFCERFIRKLEKCGGMGFPPGGLPPVGIPPAGEVAYHVSSPVEYASGGAGFAYHVSSLVEYVSDGARFAYHVSSPVEYASGGAGVSLTMYLPGAFRAPCRIFSYFSGIPSSRVTFVYSDKSNQKRRNPYGLDPLWVRRVRSGSAYGFTFTNRPDFQNGKSFICTWVSRLPRFSALLFL